MALLGEYAITPDVFDPTCYSGDGLCAVHLQLLKDVLLEEGVVRNLREEGWSRWILSSEREWHPRGKELVKKLATQGRLSPFRCVLGNDPATDREWCDEALAGHVEPELLTGVIATGSVAMHFPDRPEVAAIESLRRATWWADRGPSVRTRRVIEDYLVALDLVLRRANSVMFIDPHVRPGKPTYAGFARLLERAGRRSPSPRIEIHRVCYEGSGARRILLDLHELETEFRDSLEAVLGSAGLVAEVFIWDDFHDRHVISNLAGIGVSNGFDTSWAPNARVTWSRLSRTNRDEVQREFDPASAVHHLKNRFRLP